MINSDFYLILDKLKIKRANAISSPITYGFPAITGFLGAVHALNRKISGEWNINFDGVLVACHDYYLHTFKSSKFANVSFIQSRNPLKKNGNTSSIIEEGKIDITISLIVKVDAERKTKKKLEDNDRKKELAKKIKSLVFQQRIAGGYVAEVGSVGIVDASISDSKLKNMLIPGYILCDAKKLLVEITEELKKKKTEANSIDALIELSTIHNVSDEKGRWHVESVKKGRGWLVPIAVGFQAIDEVIEKGKLKNCRTEDYPAQYVESVYTIGKWMFPYRINDIEDCFWHYQTINNQLYLTIQTN